MEYIPPRTWEEVPAAVRAALACPFVKRANGEVGPGGIPIVRHLGDIMGWRAGPINETWGGPRPLSNLLIGAGLGSLGGYGLGRLGEMILPEEYFTRGGVRKRMAILGGALGAAPAIWQGVDNLRQSDGDLSSLVKRWPQPAKEAAEKQAGLFDPIIDREAFNEAVLQDQFTSMRLRAATAGLVEAASAVRGTQFVSPWDVARVSVGAGSGLVSGLIAGKALGLLAGLTPMAQKKIQEIGLWQGVLNNTIPNALGLNR